MIALFEHAIGDDVVTEADVKQYLLEDTEESRSGGSAADRNATEPSTARGFSVSTSRTNEGKLSTLSFV